MTFTTGYTQIYTGDGKGKTTASLGLALRAAGAGLKVYIGQFIKSGDYSEIKALTRFADQITVEAVRSGPVHQGKAVTGGCGRPPERVWQRFAAP